MEFDFVEFVPQVLLASLRGCTLLQSICFTNVLLRPDEFKGKIGLPSLREFKLVALNGFKSQSHTYDKMFWFKRKWELKDVLNLRTNIDVDCKDCRKDDFKFAIRFHQGQKSVQLNVANCTEILARKDRSVVVKHLSVEGCTLNATVIPKALDALELIDVSLVSGGLLTVLKSQKGLKTLRVTKNTLDLLYSDLPSGLQKLYLSSGHRQYSRTGIQLRLPAGSSEVILPELTELYIASENGRVDLVNHIRDGQLKLPELKKLEITANSDHPLNITHDAINKLLGLPKIEMVSLNYSDFITTNADTEYYSRFSSSICSELYGQHGSLGLSIIFRKENEVWDCRVADFRLQVISDKLRDLYNDSSE